MRERVAIVGATGIGRYYALWWFLKGAQVCAFAGTTEQSVAGSTSAIAGLFPFSRRGYTQVETMLEQERPSIVDIYQLPEFHFDHARATLETGASVLCEKPFALAADSGVESSLEHVIALRELAESRGARLAVCNQYAEAAPRFRGILKAQGDAGPLTHLLQLKNLTGCFASTYESRKSVVPHFLLPFQRPQAPMCCATWAVAPRRTLVRLCPPRLWFRCESRSLFPAL